MAIVGSQLLNTGTNSPTTSVDTASVSPTGNALLLLDVVGANGGGSAPAAPSSVTGNGLTWVQVATTTITDGATETWRITRFRAQGASPSSGVITIAHTTAPDSAMGWCLRQYTGVVTTGTNGSDAEVQTVTNTGSGTAVSASLAAFGDAGNGADALTVSFGTPTVTPEAGWTGLTADTTGGNKRAQWRDDNDTSPTSTLSGSQPWAMFATEIAAASAGTSPTGEITTSTFALEGTISNLSTTVNPTAEIVVSSFSTLVTDIKAYISGFTEISFSTFDLFGDIQGEITAVIEGTITFGKEMTIAAASTIQRIAVGTIVFGVNLIASATGGDPVTAEGVQDLIRGGASFVRGVMRNIIKTISRRY